MLDEGTYLASVRTFYRVLAADGLVRERRDQLVHPAHAKPELAASAPNQVWSWDITRLRSTLKWQHFYLYVLLDIYSRYVVGWLVAGAENAGLAQALIEETCNKYEIAPASLTLHSDRGSPMRAKTTAELIVDLGVAVQKHRLRAASSVAARHMSAAAMRDALSATAIGLRLALLLAMNTAIALAVLNLALAWPMRAFVPRRHSSFLRLQGAPGAPSLDASTGWALDPIAGGCFSGWLRGQRTTPGVRVEHRPTYKHNSPIKAFGHARRRRHPKVLQRGGQDDPFEWHSSTCSPDVEIQAQLSAVSTLA